MGNQFIELKCAMKDLERAQMRKIEKFVTRHNQTTKQDSEEEQKQTKYKQDINKQTNNQTIGPHKKNKCVTYSVNYGEY